MLNNRTIKWYLRNLKHRTWTWSNRYLSTVAISELRVKIATSVHQWDCHIRSRAKCMRLGEMVMHSLCFQRYCRYMSAMLSATCLQASSLWRQHFHRVKLVLTFQIFECQQLRLYIKVLCFNSNNNKAIYCPYDTLLYKLKYILLIDGATVIGSIESSARFVRRTNGYQFKYERITIDGLFLF